MLNFTVGPVMSDDSVRQLGSEQVPYFRTAEFSALMLENERLMKELSNAESTSRVVFLTASGTGAMEASVMNVFDNNDKLLVINGGNFGQRFVQLCQIHGIPYTEICPIFGYGINEDDLLPFDNQGYTGLLINVHETSTGVLYDMEMVSRFCKRNNLILVVDAISSFLADPLDMGQLGVDVMLTGSQKALACPPGISILVLSERAQKIIIKKIPKSLYFDLKIALKDGERGQTPFTPAVGVLRQINYRLRSIVESGGVHSEMEKIAGIAYDFRERIKGLPLELVSHSPSNAVTTLHPLNISAYNLFVLLKDEYGIWVCPNGGALRDKIFRVGHIGALTKEDNTKLIDSLKDLQKRGCI